MGLIQTVSALILVFGLLGLLYWGAHRFKGNIQMGGGARIRLLEKHSLGDRRHLLLVKVGRRSYLLGATTESISLLGSLDLEDELEVVEGKSESEEAPSFQSFLKMFQ